MSTYVEDQGEPALETFYQPECAHCGMLEAEHVQEPRPRRCMRHYRSTGMTTYRAIGRKPAPPIPNPHIKSVE